MAILATDRVSPPPLSRAHVSDLVQRQNIRSPFSSLIHTLQLADLYIVVAAKQDVTPTVFSI